MALTVVAAIMLCCGVSAVCGGVYRFNLSGEMGPQIGADLSGAPGAGSALHGSPFPFGQSQSTIASKE